MSFPNKHIVKQLGTTGPVSDIQLWWGPDSLFLCVTEKPHIFLFKQMITIFLTTNA